MKIEVGVVLGVRIEEELSIRLRINSLCQKFIRQLNKLCFPCDNIVSIVINLLCKAPAVLVFGMIHHCPNQKEKKSTAVVNS